jgi:hypothetical protein
MKKLVYLALNLLIVTSLLIGCGGDAASRTNPTAMLSATDRVESPDSTPLPPSSTPAPSATPTFTPSPTPTIVPVQDPAWSGAEVADICLDVSFSCPKAANPFNLPIGETVGELLEGMGLKVTTASGACDATLAISLVGEAYERSYTDNQNEKVSCYSGASVEGTFSLSSDQYPTLERTIKSSYSPQFSFFCPHEPGSGASWREAWLPPVVGSFFDLWGSSAAGVALMMDDNLVQEQAAAWLAKQEPEDMLGALPALISALETSAGETRGQVAVTIGKIGPPAKEAFPVLLDIFAKALEMDESSPVSINMSVYGYDVRDAMKRISGVTRANVPEDAQFWQLWWDAQQLAEVGDLDGLMDMLAGDSWESEHAARALGAMGGAAKDAVPTLIEALQYSDGEAQEAAAKAIEHIGEYDEETMRALVASLEDRAIRHFIGGVLRDIGVPAIPVLIEKASENKGEPSHYTNASKYALDLLKGITGEDYDGSAWATYKWTQVVDDFIARCWDYYHAQGGE